MNATRQILRAAKRAAAKDFMKTRYLGTPRKAARNIAHSLAKRKVPNQTLINTPD